jgi:hypothetical protein
VLEVERVARAAQVVSLPKLGGVLHTPEEILEAITSAVKGGER